MLELQLQQLANGLVIGIAYALIAVGLSVSLRVLDTVNFAHGEAVVIPGVVLWAVMTWGVGSYWLSAAIALCAVAVISFLTLRIIQRVLDRDHTSSLLATFGISVILLNVATIWLNGRSRGVQGPLSGSVELGPVVLSQQRVLLLVVGLVTLTCVATWYSKSRYGRQIQAYGENKVGAAIIGIDARKLGYIIFIGSGLLAGLAGVLLAPINQVSAAAGMPLLIKAIIVTVIGGIGSIKGAIIGGLLLGATEAMAAVFIGSEWTSAIGFGLLLVLLLAAPKRVASARAV